MGARYLPVKLTEREGDALVRLIDRELNDTQHAATREEIAEWEALKRARTKLSEAPPLRS